jgi:hypothetical protein
MTLVVSTNPELNPVALEFLDKELGLKQTSYQSKYENPSIKSTYFVHTKDLRA